MSEVTTILTMYTIHLATIKAFGLKDSNHLNKWDYINIDQLKMINKQHRISTNTADAKKDGIAYMKEYAKHHQNELNKNIDKITMDFNNLDHSQKLKKYKRLNSTNRYHDDEPQHQSCSQIFIMFGITLFWKNGFRNIFTKTS